MRLPTTQETLAETVSVGEWVWYGLMTATITLALALYLISRVRFRWAMSWHSSDDVRLLTPKKMSRLTAWMPAAKALCTVALVVVAVLPGLRMVSSNEDAPRNNAASDPNRDVPQVIKASGQIQFPDDDELGAMLERRDLIKAGAVVVPNTRDA